MTSAKLLLVRLTGVVVIGGAFLGVLLSIRALLSPTGPKLSTYAPAYEALALIIGLGMLFLRKWAIVIFLIGSLCAAGAVLRESFKPEISKWIYLNLLFLAVPIGGCIAAWKELK